MPWRPHIAHTHNMYAATVPPMQRKAHLLLIAPRPWQNNNRRYRSQSPRSHNTGVLGTKQNPIDPLELPRPPSTSSWFLLVPATDEYRLRLILLT
jgi:hypothetical protein